MSVSKQEEFEAMSDAFKKYSSQKLQCNITSKVNATDWTIAWNYAKDFYSEKFQKEIEKLKALNKS